MVRTEAPPRTDRNLLTTAGVLILGVLAPLLDTTIVNVALDTLGRSLQVSVADLQWVTTGYLLALALAIPLTGWATERFGARRMWLVALGTFLAGSVLAALSWNLGSLIAFRVLQGVGSGLLLPIMQTMLFRAAGGRPSGRTMALISLPVLVGPVFGPVIGGLIVEHLSWRWIFYVNLPVIVAAVAAAVKYLPADVPAGRLPLDLPGLLLLSPGLAAAVYGLSRAGEDGPGSPTVAGPVIAGLLLIALFARHALRTAHPLVDLRLFADRSFATSSTVLLLAGLSMFGAMLLLPLWYQQVQHRSVLAAGLLLAPQGIGIGLARVSGVLIDRYGPRPLVLAGVVLTALGTLPFALADADASPVLLTGALVVRGAGLGTVIMAVMLSVYSGLGHGQIPHASSLTRILQQLGGSLGTAALAVVLQRGLAGATTTAARAEGFRHAFAWALALTVVALLPALLIPRTGPAAPEAAPDAAVDVAVDVAG